MSDEQKYPRILNGVHERDYARLHWRLKNSYGPAPLCIFDDKHKSKRFEWANVTDIVSDSIEDYLPMCQSCHRRFDITEKGLEGTRQGNLGNKNAKRTSVICFDGNGSVRVFDSIHEAERQLGILHTAIANCLSGRSKTAGGFVWKREV